MEDGFGTDLAAKTQHCSGSCKRQNLLKKTVKCWAPHEKLELWVENRLLSRISNSLLEECMELLESAVDAKLSADGDVSVRLW
nr:hypothetical protein BaRGS_015903 [Batillaria attramentaria]